MNNNVVIIDYKVGNTTSVAKALDKLGFKSKLSHKKSDINKASHIILPGVGAFGDGMRNLNKLEMPELLLKKVRSGTPFLGICLGMQLLAEKSYEFGEHDGLGWIKGEVVKIKAARLPHVGWNDIKVKNKQSLLFKNIPDNNFYFVHSYTLKPLSKPLVSATCEYGQNLVAAIEKNNIFGVQFHPEKSQTAGLKVLENFLNYHA